MTNKVRVRILEDSKYAIKLLYKLHIDIYNIEYTSDGTLYTIDEKNIEKLDLDNLEIISYGGLKSTIIKLNIYRHFILSCIASIVLIFLLSNIVFEVQVIHSNKNIRNLIEDSLYEEGIRPLIIKKSFDEIQRIKSKIKEEHKTDIEWIEIVDDGMKYTVRVEERIITTPSTSREYCNIVSTKDAIVTSIASSKGQVVVDINDHVNIGDTLISGEIKFDGETKSHTCAEGEVYGTTWYKISISVPLEYEVKEYTGNKKYNIGFNIGSVYNRIFKIHYDEYDIEKTKLFSLWSFTLYKESIREYSSLKKNYNENEALEQALKTAREKLLIRLDDTAEILDEKVLQTDVFDSIINVDIFYSVKESITRQVESDYIENTKEELD